MSLSAGLGLMLTAGFVSLCWFGVEESLEAVELQVSGGDDDQTLESRPAVHISRVGLKQKKKKKKKKPYPLSFSPSLASLYLFEQ